MKTPTWKETEAALNQLQPEKSMREKEEFWRTFEARASQLPRDYTVESPENAGWFSLRWAAVAATAIVVVVIIVTVSLNGLKSPVKDSQIRAYEIGVSHNKVQLLKDPKTDSTILWITDTSNGE